MSMQLFQTSLIPYIICIPFSNVNNQAQPETNTADTDTDKLLRAHQ